VVTIGVAVPLVEGPVVAFVVEDVEEGVDGVTRRRSAKHGQGFTFFARSCIPLIIFGIYLFIVNNSQGFCQN
jgi:hypothetical protein